MDIDRLSDDYANGKIEPKMGAKWRILAKIFANPDPPEIDDYYEPFDFDYGHLQSAPEMMAWIFTPRSGSFDFSFENTMRSVPALTALITRSSSE